MLKYYEILGVTKDASQSDIKKAYRSKAMELHPDRNQGKDTTAEFQNLQEAYDVLSDEKLRQQYDADSSIPPNRTNNEEESYKPFEPIVCSKCSAVSAQPRFKVFCTVYSYVFGAYKKPYQGVFCSKCEIKVGLKASAITIVAGWWSITGFFWTIQTLFENLIGGRFHEQNARLQGYQAMYFAQHGKLALARAVALEALKLAKVATASNNKDFSFKKNLGYETPDPLATLKETLSNFIGSIPDTTEKLELKNTNDVFNKRFYLQLLLIVIVASIGFAEVQRQEYVSREAERIRLEQLGIEKARAAAIAAQQEAELKKLEQPLPINGVFKAANRSNINRYDSPPLKISNAPGANTLMKLIRIKDNAEVMSIFIRAGQTVEVKVPLGSYKAKIASGQTWYGDAVRFGPNTSYATLDTVLEFSVQGNQLLGNELMLTRVRDGNLRQGPLSASEF
jgi:curved DNA-binding protein CbpA